MTKLLAVASINQAGYHCPECGSYIPARQDKLVPTQQDKLAPRKQYDIEGHQIEMLRKIAEQETTPTPEEYHGE